MSNKQSGQDDSIRAFPGKMMFSDHAGLLKHAECKWSTDGSVVTYKSQKVVEIDLTGRSLNHKLELALEPALKIELEAAHGEALFEKLISKSITLGLTPQVCGNCRNFKRSGMINDWSFGFEGYCRLDSQTTDPVFSNSFARCGAWTRKLSH